MAKKLEPIGATVGKSTAHTAQAVLLNNDTNLFNFITVNKILCQISDVSVNSELSVEEAKDIARGKKARPMYDVIAKLDVLVRGVQPIMPGSLLKRATAKEIKDFLFGNGKMKNKVNLGKLLSRDTVDITIDGSFLNNHLAILGMIGMGKSNTGKVILSQTVWSGANAIVIDPHGEYEGEVIDVDNYEVNGSVIHMDRVLKRMRETIPTKLQKILDTVIKSVKMFSDDESLKSYKEACDDDWIDNGSLLLPELVDAVKMEAVINYISIEIMCHNYVKPLVINLKGMKRDNSLELVKHIAELVLEQGKKGHGSYLFIDESHIYIPQKGSAPSKQAIIDLITEGRKFKCGVVLLSQRPARIDKDVLSQCNSKIILKLTNENDIRQVRASTEFSSKQMFSEVQKLRMGEALFVSASIERPVFVKIKKYNEE